MSRPRQPRSTEALDDFLTKELPQEIKTAAAEFAREYAAAEVRKALDQAPELPDPNIGQTKVQLQWNIVLQNAIWSAITDAYNEGLRQGSNEAI